MQEQFNFSIADEIYRQHPASENCLAMQVSHTHFGYCIYQADGKKLIELRRYVFEKTDEKQLQKVIDENPRLQETFFRIVTSLDFGFNSLLPAGMDNGDATPLMYLENADQQHHVITELITEKEIANIYSVPSNVLNCIVSFFPSSGYFHRDTVQIKSIAGAYEQGLLKVDVEETVFTVTAFKNEKLLLSKTYTYHASADMIFYLLKICNIFALAQEQVILQLSGLIDVHSKLYRELYDYFLNISFKSADWMDTITDLPAHYFTSLNELVLCELFQEV